MLWENGADRENHCFPSHGHVTNLACGEGEKQGGQISWVFDPYHGDPDSAWWSSFPRVVPLNLKKKKSGRLIACHVPDTGRRKDRNE